MASFVRSFGAVLPNVVDVVRRFPVSVVVAVCLTGYVIWGAARNVDVVLPALGLLTLFFVSLGASLFGERRDWGAGQTIGLAVLSVLVIAPLFLFSEMIGLTAGMMPVAGVLAAGSVAYLTMPEDNRAFWMFNHTYWFSLLIAVFGGLLIAGLVALLIAAYAMLFDVQIDKLYQYSFIVSLFLIAPLFWLSLLPKSLTVQVEEGEPVEFTSKVTALFVKYVFVPFFFLFALLLHGLAVKIALEGALPSGQIGWYGLLLMIGGVGTFLMAYPTRHVSGPLVRFFVNNWMWFLLVPLGLVIAAHYLRVVHYGMTPLRFFLAGLFVWAAILIGYGFYLKYRGRSVAQARDISGVFDLRLIPVLAAFILFGSSIGPWGAEAVSTSWQKNRLVSDLTELGVLEKGVIAQPLPPRSFKDKAALATQARDTLGYFRDRRRAEALLGLLPPEARDRVKQDVAAKGPIERQTSRVYLAVSDALNAGGSPGDRARRNVHSYRVQQPYELGLSGAGRVRGPIYYGLRDGLVQQEADNLPAEEGAQSASRKVISGLDGPVNLTVRTEGKALVVSKGKKGEDGDVIGRFALDDLEALARQDLASSQQKDGRKKIGQVTAQSRGAALYIYSLAYFTTKESGDEVVVTGIGFWLFEPR